MKFQFKIQQYQTDAVESVASVFSGQPYQDMQRYVRAMDLGQEPQLNLFPDSEPDGAEVGFKNARLLLTDEQLLLSVRAVQARNNIKQSTDLSRHLGRCSLDVEMETGTGKTYVYIKTMFELQKRYGWSKFIVVVPSIAIREGVMASFRMTEEHFMQLYGRKARPFIYNSKDLSELDGFASSSGLSVMIINTQAFAASLNEEKNAEGRKGDASARIIYSSQDKFGSRRPIDVVSACRPIIILDEPQKMNGRVTQKALGNFGPLFCLNYSATHAQRHNMVYALDALDAYNQRLVKKIEVKGIEVKNLRGTDCYIFLEDIIVSPRKPPQARLELEVRYKNSINREPRLAAAGDDLFDLSHHMEQYRGYHVSEVDPLRGTVSFTNGETISRGELQGDVSEQDVRRIQIRETILSHFEKERRNFELGVKTLSLFFIDEVAKYRVYDATGDEVNSEYGDIFEQEYANILEKYLAAGDTAYTRYLREKCSDPSAVHAGYFSIDRRGRKVDSAMRRGGESDDVSAYDLILKNKERLLSFSEPVRFIFSHSALREGWDNPNVFQICALKHSDSATSKRQEVGRGLRLAVSQSGERMDEEYCGSSVHDINILTVIASESYRQFVDGLQRDIREDLYDRPAKADMDYFEGKTVMHGETPVVLDARLAKDIYRYLLRNEYVDDDDAVTDAYRSDYSGGCLAELPERLADMTESIHTLIRSVFDERALADMIFDGHETRISTNPLNDNFYTEEFQELWAKIRQKYAYTVEFGSGELIENAIAHINDKMFVTRLKYTVTTGLQARDMEQNALARGDGFKNVKSRTEALQNSAAGRIKYDLVGKLAEGASLTRRTAAAIIAGLDARVFAMFGDNPEEFIAKAVRLTNEKKAELIKENISYHPTGESYDETIFTAGKAGDFAHAFEAARCVQDYVFTDGLAEKSVERRFVEALDGAEEVRAYAKLPKKYVIPTPVGNYTPDWAIAFCKGKVKHIFFVAETKGSTASPDLRPIEEAKIACAKRLFNDCSHSGVRFHEVSDYDELLDLMEKL